MAHPLDDPRAKIGRAEKHLAEFESERQNWLKASPYYVFTYPNPNKTEWKFILHRFDDPVQHENDVFGLIIGDYVHALRSALDHLVWLLITVANKRTVGKDDERLIAFPIITRHPRDFWGLKTVSHLRTEQALLLEGFQPYRAIGMEKTTPLANLHALWNADKHRLITPIKVTLSKEGPVFGGNADAGQILTTKWDSEITLQGDAEIAWATTEPPVGPEPEMHVTSLPVDVAFGESGRPIESLPALLAVTRDIVENCAHFFQ